MAKKAFFSRAFLFEQFPDFLPQLDERQILNYDASVHEKGTDKKIDGKLIASYDLAMDVLKDMMTEAEFNSIEEKETDVKGTVIITVPITKKEKTEEEQLSIPVAEDVEKTTTIELNGRKITATCENPIALGVYKQYLEAALPILEKYYIPRITEKEGISILFGSYSYVEPRGPKAKGIRILLCVPMSDDLSITKAPSDIFGVTGYTSLTPPNADMLMPTENPEAEPVIYKDAIIAQAINKDLYVYFDIIHETHPQCLLDAFLAILSNSYSVLLPTTEEKEQIEQKKKEILIAKIAEQIAVGMTSNIKKMEQNFTSLNAKYTSLMAEIVTVSREAREIEKIIAATKGEPDAIKAKLIEDLQMVAKMKKVKRVYPVGSTICIDTEVLYCKHPTTQNIHEIGAFTIEVYMNGTSGGMKWINKTRKIKAYSDKMNAPHVYNSGEACMGNFKEILPNAIAQGNIYNIALLGIQFIESVNIADAAGKYIEKWPIARKWNAETKTYTEVEVADVKK